MSFTLVIVASLILWKNMLESNQVKNKIQMPFYDLKSPTKSVPYPPLHLVLSPHYAAAKLTCMGSSNTEVQLKIISRKKKIAKAGSGGTHL